MEKSQSYTVQYNYCQCHPETCCCNPWAVHKPDGTRHSTFYSKDTATEVASALNGKVMK